MKVLLALALFAAACTGGSQAINGYSYDPTQGCDALCDEMTAAVRQWASSRGGATSIDLHRPYYGDGNLRKRSGGGYFVAVVKLADGSTTATGVACSMGCTAGLPWNGP